MFIIQDEGPSPLRILCLTSLLAKGRANFTASFASETVTKDIASHWYSISRLLAIRYAAPTISPICHVAGEGPDIS